METILWHWILEQKAFELQNLEIDVSKISNLIFIDLKCDFNERSFITDDLNQLQ